MVHVCKLDSEISERLLQNPEPKDQISKMIKILSGEMAIELHLQFLIRNNNTDLMILKNTKRQFGVAGQGD
ncbi:hypothetical protein CIB84_012257 [Bambusicola thoracicus]|uniref:Uncharacterized protein n=1 Tax=Bambusicola thoracicus TaxID=9083 RepID=A0A2P4SIR0_BAMTH|nr:hypothetical protein CIB84_012257 [Bambusicola thoracicus]